jgi:hypothetical protein
MKKKLRERGTSAVCYICTHAGADTRDHVVAKGFLPEPPPANLLTLPAHRACQNPLSSSENYVRNILAALADDGSLFSARRLPQRAANKAYRRDSKLRSEIAGGVHVVQFESPAGLSVGASAALKFDRERFYPSLNKIIRGLYYMETGAFLPADVEIRWGQPNGQLDAQLTAVFGSSVKGFQYAGIFESRYFLGSELAIWFLTFYGRSRLHCVFPSRMGQTITRS